MWRESHHFYFNKKNNQEDNYVQRYMTFSQLSVVWKHMTNTSPHITLRPISSLKTQLAQYDHRLKQLPRLLYRLKSYLKSKCRPSQNKERSHVCVMMDVGFNWIPNFGLEPTILSLCPYRGSSSFTSHQAMSLLASRPHTSCFYFEMPSLSDMHHSHLYELSQFEASSHQATSCIRWYLETICFDFKGKLGFLLIYMPL